MGFKTGLLAGLAVGYYLGAKAGRERYEQIDRYLAPIRESEGYEQLRVMARDLCRQGVAATRQAFKDATAPEGAVIEIRRAG